MDWLYRFASNNHFPDPFNEIDQLCMIDEEGKHAFLLLGNKKSPPMCAAKSGEVVGLCTEENGRLILHGTGVIEGPCISGVTPRSVEELYGPLQGGTFSPLIDLVRLPSGPLSETVLSLENQATFLSGQAYVKSLRAGTLVSGKNHTAGLHRERL